jgi:hypothetical protein
VTESIDKLYDQKEAELAARMKAGWNKSLSIDSLPNDEPRLWRTQAPVGSCHGHSSCSAARAVTSAAEIKKILEDIEPMVKVGRSWNDAFLVMRPEMMAHAMKIEPEMFVEAPEPPHYRFMHLFDYMPVYTNRWLMKASGMVSESDWPVETTPVLPRLMTKEVPEVKQKDLSFWQALVCVVVLGWILVSLGGAL